MTLLLNILIVAFVGFVTLVLAMGLFNMARNGDLGLSQKLMRMRVGLQFVAVLLIMMTVYFTRG